MDRPPAPPDRSARRAHAPDPITPDPTSPVPASPVPATSVPTIPGPATSVSTTPGPTTPLPATSVPTIPGPTTPVPTNPVPATPGQGTHAPGGQGRRYEGVRRRRLALGAAGALTIGLGLGIHFRGSGAVADFAGDALYAALAYLVVAVIAPRAGSVRIGAVAFGLCAAVEFFQLTGIPQGLSTHLPAAALLLGSTFSPIDLLAYAAGVTVATALDTAARAARHSRRTRTDAVTANLDE